jgi:hypothetical protein
MIGASFPQAKSVVGGIRKAANITSKGGLAPILLKNSFLAAHLNFAAPLSRQYKKDVGDQ